MKQQQTLTNEQKVKIMELCNKAAASHNAENISRGALPIRAIPLETPEARGFASEYLGHLRAQAQAKGEKAEWFIKSVPLSTVSSDTMTNAAKSFASSRY